GQHAHFQVQTNPKADKPRFCRFSCAIVHEFFVIQNSQNKMAKIFHGCSPWIFCDPKFPKQNGQNLHGHPLRS
ncbi:hypothetical protein H5410_026151, partial [Solanum commersonii]